MSVPVGTAAVNLSYPISHTGDQYVKNCGPSSREQKKKPMPTMQRLKQDARKMCNQTRRPGIYDNTPMQKARGSVGPRKTLKEVHKDLKNKQNIADAFIRNIERAKQARIEEIVGKEKKKKTDQPQVNSP